MVPPPTFLFDTLWPIMKIFQMVGGFPCKKVFIGDVQTLAPIKSWAYFCISFVPLVMSLISIIVINTMAYSDFIRVMKMHTSVIDRLAMFGTVVVFFAVQVSLAFNNFALRHQMVDIQDYFLKNCHPAYLEKIERRKKIRCMALFVPLVSLFAAVSVSLAGTMESFENQTKPQKIITSLFFTLMILYIQSQIHAFLLIYMQVTTKIISWTTHLTKTVQSAKNDLKDCLTLFECVLKAKRMFSVPLFVTVCGALVNLILVIYAIISHLMCTSSGCVANRDLVSILADCFGKASKGLLLCIILYITNEASQQLYNALQDMKQAIIDLPVDDTVTVLNGKEYPGTYARYVVLEKINTFKGFTACDYYDLGRPMLSTITSNFITYVIILIQFKMSASSNE